MEQHRTSRPQGRRRPKSPGKPPVAPPPAAPHAAPSGPLAEGASAHRVTRGAGRAPGGARAERAGSPGTPGRTPDRAPARRPGGRPVPPVVLALRRLPAPRLTGLGAGLFASAVMLAAGLLDLLLLDASPVAYGLVFLLVSALTALWVRTADLVTAPIGVPIAFAVGIVPVAGGTGGLGSQAMAVVTALAVQAGWLYGGTLVAGVITSVRKVRDMGRRQRRPRPGRGAAGPPSPASTPAPKDAKDAQDVKGTKGTKTTRAAKAR
ncbi:DUF6542 domain-containing protein [Streptomyces sp. NPDC001744]|uniref:DUF6542 domain-containing protein n=1 Tax=Streptomyces sp. NPDC001744 TaxID=3364606 RepID=UPI0036AFB201